MTCSDRSGADVPDVVFQVILPIFWVWLIMVVAVNRWRVMRQLGRDPVVLRPWDKAESPTKYLERALSIAALTLTLDVVLNAITHDVVTDRLGIGVLRSSPMIGYVGLASLACGVVFAAIAVRQMGASWRIGIDYQAAGPLVSKGLFARVRHPIYAGMLLATAGIAAVTADALSVAVAAAASVGLPVQARLEEAFLSSRYPEQYPVYAEQTGRFLPKIV
jgi:protein-S-isoprenylcysteine O-methyltransferase Ste14